MPRHTPSTAALAVALSLLLVGCPADDAAETEPDGDAAAVTISGSQFEPDSLEVAAGTTVTFENEDAVGHTVTAGAPDEETGEFDESLSSQGATSEVTFDEPGTYPYFCRIHQSMRGEIVVEP